MMTSLRRLFLLPVAACLVGLSGCSSVKLDPKGDMVAVYQFGEFKMLFNTTAPVVADAARKVAQELDLYETSFKKTKFDAELNARARNDQLIVVRVQEVNSRQSLISIRWGKAGDQKKSRKFYEMMEATIGPN